MLKGLYQAAAGMKARLASQDIIANNLANAGTSGFQREIASVEARSYRPLGASTRSAAAVAGWRAPGQVLQTLSSTDTQAGTLEHTGSKSDVALDGAGYLTVQTGRGTRLIRGGPLSVNRAGQLATLSGEPLLGVNGGPIRVDDKPWQVSEDGTVTAGGASVGRLRVVIPTGAARREGASLLAAGGTQDAGRGAVRVRQGYLEHSNVEPIREMVDMISGMRAYESAQRAVVAQDQTLQSLLDVLRR